MYESLDLFRLSAAMARYAGQKQAVAAVNVANSDTPGYRAQALPSFAETLGSSDRAMRTTRAGHLGASGAAPLRTRDEPGEAAPNGNTVSIEAEMFASVEAAREQGRALAIWRHGLTVLRASLGR